MRWVLTLVPAGLLAGLLTGLLTGCPADPGPPRADPPPTPPADTTVS